MKNVVLLTIDTLRRDALGCYGGKNDLTPFIDSIQNKCIRFTQAHSVAPYTQASFPGILTSSYLFDLPRSRNLSPKRTLVSEVLKKAGIRTAGFHSNPYLCSFFGWNRGWDHYYDSMEDDVDPMSPYIDGETVNTKADAWLKTNCAGKNDAPFFMWVHYMDVHEPYVPERKYIEKVDSSITETKQQMFDLFKEVLLKRDTSNPDTIELFKKLYSAHVCQVDDYTRMLFNILEKHNLLENTDVIITTDHGDEFGDHGSLSHDGKFYSELVHVPLMIYSNTYSQGTIVNTPVSGIDTSPTILNMFALNKEPGFQGQSLLPLDEYQSDGCFGEAIGKLSHKIKPSDEPAYFCFQDNMKIIYREEEKSWELYDLKTDPGEKENIIDSSDKTEEMKKKLLPRINRQSE